VLCDALIDERILRYARHAQRSSSASAPTATP
jgi:hypothetical protein